MTTKIQKWGNSLGIRIPAKLLESLGIVEGDILEITEYNGSIILKKQEILTIEERIEDYEPFSYTEWDPNDIQGRELW